MHGGQDGGFDLHRLDVHDLLALLDDVADFQHAVFVADPPDIAHHERGDLAFDHGVGEARAALEALLVGRHLHREDVHGVVHRQHDVPHASDFRADGHQLDRVGLAVLLEADFVPHRLQSVEPHRRRQKRRVAVLAAEHEKVHGRTGVLEIQDELGRRGVTPDLRFQLALEGLDVFFLLPGQRGRVDPLVLDTLGPPVAEDRLVHPIGRPPKRQRSVPAQQEAFEVVGGVRIQA